jgi:lysophospholipase L1-like esterase
MIKDFAKTILCYGDSNTWGQVPRSAERHPRSVRWPSVLQNLLGDDFEIITEGLRGRTFSDGLPYISMLLSSHKPIDTVIIMLGGNDLKNLDPKEIATKLEKTIHIIKEKNIPKIIIICPTPTIKAEVEAKSEEGRKLDEAMARGIGLSTELSRVYKEVAEKYGCMFIDAGDHILSSTKDGYHLDAESHVKLAQVIAEKLS